MNGTFTTVDGSVINNDCANDYSVNLRNSMDLMQVIVNQLLVSGELCGNMPEVDIVALDTTITAFGQYVIEMFLIAQIIL